LLLDYKTGYTMKYQQQLEEYQTAKWVNGFIKSDTYLHRKKSMWVNL
jgi:hypothetical protein